MRFLIWSYEDPRMLAVLLVVDMGGIAFGFWWYRDQLAATPWWWWPLVPDSPMAIVVFSAALLLRRLRVPQPWIEWLGWLLMVKVGVWTVMVLLYQRSHLLAPPLLGLNGPLLVLHAAMAAQALVLLHRMQAPRWWQVAALLAALWASDGVDYLLDLHPMLPAEGLQTVAAATMVLSPLCVAALVVLLQRWPAWPGPRAVGGPTGSSP